MNLEDDVSKACQQHKEWFDALTRATRHTTTTVHTLQRMLSEKWLGAGAASADTAVSLSDAWAAVEKALDEETEVLADTLPLRNLHCCVQMAMAFAEKLKEYLSRTEGDYHLLQTLDSSLRHLAMFPELQDDDDFLDHLEDVTGLSISFDAGTGEHGSQCDVAIPGDNIPDFKKLSQHWQALSQRGVAIPRFVVRSCRLYARYAVHSSMDLKEFGGNYEVTESFLTRLWAALASAAAEFRRHVGREHDAIKETNIFVDAMTERITLGAHAISLDHQADGGADVPALFLLCEELGSRHGVALRPGSSLKFRVECDSCSSLCARSITCPSEKHYFCEECMGNLMSSQTDQSGAMRLIACPMGCGSMWSV